MGVNDLVAIGKVTKYVTGLPVESGEAGGDPGPFTALGVYLSVLAAIRRGLRRESAKDVHVAIQGVGSVGSNVARRLAADGARLTLADVQDSGVFVGALPDATPFPYRLRVTWPQGPVDLDDPFAFPALLGDVDVHLLAEGNHLEAWKKLGAHPLKHVEACDGGIEYRLDPLWPQSVDNIG